MRFLIVIGSSKYTTIFNGLFTKIEMKKHLDSKIYIREDRDIKLLLFDSIEKNIYQTRFSSDSKVELDSQEFEEYFNVYASNKIVTMQLLTADIMQSLIDFRNEMKIPYEITIKGNIIYIRYWCGQMFEPSLMGNFSLDRKLLYQYYRMLEFANNLSNKLVKTVNEIE